MTIGAVSPESKEYSTKEAHFPQNEFTKNFMARNKVNTIDPEVLNLLSPTTSKVVSQYVLFAKIAAKDGGLDIKVTDLAHFELKESYQKKLEEKLHDYVSQTISKIEEAGKAPPSIDPTQPTITSEEPAAKRQKVSASKKEDSPEAKKSADAKKDVLESTIEKGEYQKVIFTVDESGRQTLFLEESDKYNLSTATNINFRFKTASGVPPVTISTDNIQIVQLEKGSPILAKAFMCLLIARGDVNVVAPTTVEANATSGDSKKEAEATRPETASTPSDSIRSRSRQAVVSEEHEKGKSAAMKGQERASANYENAMSASAAKGRSQAEQKRLDEERRVRQERTREEIIQNDIKHTEQKGIKTAESVKHQENIQDAINTAEGKPPKADRSNKRQKIDSQ